MAFRVISPIRRHHRLIAALYAGSLLHAPLLHRPRLYGIRRLAWPAMAMQADTSMGPCRHALEQMVVAGTITFLPAFPPPFTRRPTGNETHVPS